MKYLKKVQKNNIFIVAIILSLLLISSLVAIMIIPNTNFALTTNEKNIINTLSSRNIVLENTTNENILVNETYVNNIQNTSFKEKEIVENVITNIENIEKKDNSLGLINPLENCTISTKFGKSNGIEHTGIDLEAEIGTKIVASTSGTVIFSGNRGSYGKFIILDNGNGVETYYAHCSKLLVNTGAIVNKGDIIAEVGMSGQAQESHLHFEVHLNKEPVNPQNYLY